MKLEIGESLISSWLKHDRSCQVVHLNWKPSTHYWNIQNYNEIQRFVGFVSNYFEKQYQFKLFKNTNSIDQIIKQAEIDVLGLQLNKGSIDNIFAVDVAFHEGGLTYGGKNETAARVAKKIIRAVICINGYFEVRSGEIIFASPKVHKSTLDEITPLLKGIEELLKTFNLDFNVHFIANEQFEEEILNPVLEASKHVADTSELFIRSVQMMNLFSKSPQVEAPVNAKVNLYVEKPVEKLHKPNNDTQTPNVITKDGNHITRLSDKKEMKIGELAQRAFRLLVRENLLTEDDLYNLTSEKYSKVNFDVNFPILKELEPSMDIKLQLQDSKGYLRYYKTLFNVNGKKCALTSQWYDCSRTKLENWLRKRDL